MLILDVADHHISMSEIEITTGDPWKSMAIEKEPVGNILIIENKPSGNEHKI